MCLISIAPRGTDKYSDFFLEAIRYGASINSDGIGMSFRKKDDDRIYYNKGFRTFDKFYEIYKTHGLTIDDDVIIHCRRKSNGLISVEACHPFILTPNNEDIDSAGPNMTKCATLFHNGYLYNFDKLDPEHSDTYNFARHFMRNKDILSMLKTKPEVFKQLFGDLIKEDRFAIMLPVLNSSTITLGNFFTENGYSFSNINYKPSVSNTTDSKNIKEKTKQITLFNKPNKIIPTKGNYKELTLVANCDAPISKIHKGDCFYIEHFDDKTGEILICRPASAEYKNMTYDLIKIIFDAEPRIIFKRKYEGFFKLTDLCGTSKSKVKKVNGKVKRMISRKDRKVEYTVDTEFNLRMSKTLIIPNLRIDSIRLYLDMYGDFINERAV